MVPTSLMIDVSCTAAFVSSTVARLSRDDFTRHFSRVSVRA
jgi:hypothetical protein